MARDERQWRARAVKPWLVPRTCCWCDARFVREPGWLVWQGYAGGPSRVCDDLPPPRRDHGRIICAACAPDANTAIARIRAGRDLPPGPLPPPAPPNRRGIEPVDPWPQPEAGTPDPFDMPTPAEMADAFGRLGTKLGRQYRKAMDDVALRAIQKGRTDGQASA